MSFFLKVGFYKSKTIIIYKIKRESFERNETKFLAEMKVPEKTTVRIDE